MVFAALAPFIPMAVEALGGLFGGGGDKGGGGSDAAKTAALGSLLAQPGGGKSEVIADNPVTKGTDLPPILATVMNGSKSGHVVLPHAATASGKMGHHGVLAPHLEQALTNVHARQVTAPLRKHNEQAARATVKRVQASVAPHLEEMRKTLRDRAVQVQATAEHRALVQRDARYRALADKQTQIIAKLDRIGTQLQRRWAV